MREFVKVLCVAVLLFAAPAAFIVWTDDRPTETVWMLRVACPLLCLAALAVFLKLALRKDDAPDYLEQIAGNYFNRDGFCFAFAPEVEGDICYLNCYFQNQHDQPSIGRVALQPSRGFFLTREKMEVITFEIPCEAAAFGVAKIPIPLPEKVRGKQQSFDVGASVNYPNGKGRRLRFKDGLTIRTNSNFGDTFGTALTVAGALTGQIVLSSPANVKLKLPENGAANLPDDVEPSIVTVWKLGDPPLNAEDAS